jgi:hypothetical protein
LQVWEREDCALHVTGEDTSGLLGSVDWQPSGVHSYVWDAKTDCKTV